MNALQNEAQARLSSFLPQTIQGWTPASPGDLYNAETIFDYIDGAGEVYRAFNMKTLLSRRYAKPDRPDIIVDLFDMGSSADAFGVFTHDLDGENPDIGQGSNYKSGLLSFWRDRYFISVAADRENAESRNAVLEFGRSIAAAVGRDGAKPALLRRLPPEWAETAVVRFFHSHVIMNYHFFVSRENILGLDSGTDAVMAARGKKGEDGHLLIVTYPSAERAMAACRRFIEAYMPDAGAARIVQTEDKKWTAARLDNTTLAVIFGAPSEAAAQTILKQVFR